MEKENGTKEKSGNWKNILIIILLVVIAGLVMYISFNAGVKLAESEDNVEENDNVKENDDNTNIDDSDDEDDLPYDIDLLGRSEELVMNFNDLLDMFEYGLGEQSYTFTELKVPVYKAVNTNALVDKINDTFINGEIAMKYVPFYEKDGVYYISDGSGGFYGSGQIIFEYSVKSKSTDKATIVVDYAECYAEGEYTIASCPNVVSDTSKEDIILNLVNQDGKWLIESMTSDMTQSLLK